MTLDEFISKAAQRPLPQSRMAQVRALENTHTIRVLEETALAYNNAIVEMLNRFGITP